MDRTAAIVGCGLVGGGWAIVFARAGWTVRLYDGKPGAAAAARALIADRLADLAGYGLIDDAGACLARIGVAEDLAAALDGAAYVQESVFERTDVKRAVFAEIDAVIGPDTLVGSSSSGIPASAYTDHVACRPRCLVAHPVNPPYLVPVVELVPAPWTAPETVKAVRAIMDAVGQVPVELTREVEGFALNRLQGVLLREAWMLVEEGVISVADLDKTVSDGLGLRWSFMGPFETIDLNAPGGVADYAARLGGLYRSIAASRSHDAAWSDDLVARVEAERREALAHADLGRRGAWRDRRLMALARHRREAVDREGA